MRNMMVSASIVVAFTFQAACGKPSTPTGPDPTPRLTVAEAGPDLSRTVASTIVAALEGPASAAHREPRPTALARLAAMFLPATLHAQSQFTRNCPNGGSVRIERVVVTGGRYTLSNSSATFAGCAFTTRGRTATMNGALALNGAWCPGQGSCSGPSVTQPETPVRTTGSLDVSDLGSVPFIGSVGPGSYAFDLGCSGCVFQGRPDTLPPATCSATVSPTSFNASAAGATFTVTVTTGNACQWTASGSGFVTIAAGVSRFGSGIVQVSVAQNTGAARTGSATVAGQTVTVNQAAGTVPPTTLDLSGNWTQSFAGGTQTMILMQSGSNLTGRAVGGAVAGVIQTSTVTGTVSGNVVTLMEVDTATTTVQGITASCRITINYTLTASSSSRMTGSYTFTGTCTVTGLPPGTPLPPLPPISGNGSVTFTK